MKKYRVIFTAEVMAQLEEMEIYIENRAGYKIANSWVSRIRTYCQGFSIFPRRGKKRDDLMPGLRIAYYKKRVSIAFIVERDSVVITGIFGKGQNVDPLLVGLAEVDMES